MRAAIHLARKDLTLLLREPFYLVMSLILPLVFFLFFALISEGSATQPVAIARESAGPWSDKLLEIIRQPPEGRRRLEAPYWEVVTTDPETARRLYAENRAMGLITIPPGFDAALAAGQPVRLPIAVNNINSDYTKNLWLRVDHNALTFNQEVSGALVQVQEEAWLPHDVPMMSYMMASLVAFAFLYGGMVNTAVAVAREWEDGTVKELLLSPYGHGGVVGGKMIVGLLETFLSGAIVYGATYLVKGFVPAGELGPILLLLTLTALVGVGLGALIGVWLRQVMPAVQIAMVLGLISFILGSGLSPMSGVAWGGVSEALWRFSLALPPTYAYHGAHLLMNAGLSNGLATDLLVLGGSGGLAVGAATWSLARAFSRAPKAVKV